MTNLNLVKKGVTHAGRFHTDDVLCTVLLKKLIPSIVIERTNECEYDDTFDDVIVYDIGRGEFDHHQLVREINEFGQPYSAFGKLWRAFGRELLESQGFTKIEEAFNKFNRFYVSKVDEGDNNSYKYVKHFMENNYIVDFNLRWYEESNKNNDDQFNCAVEFATKLFDNWLRLLYAQIEMSVIEDEIWNEAIDKMVDGIITLRENINWRLYLKKENVPGLKLVICESTRGGYSVTSVNENEIEILDSEYLVFIHPGKFMGMANTYEEAVLAARYTLNLK